MTEQPQQPTAPAAPATAPPVVAQPPAPAPPGMWAIVLTPLTPGVLVDGTVCVYEGGGCKFNLATPEAQATFLCQDRRGFAEALVAWCNLAPAVVGEHNVEVIVKSGKKQRKFMLRDLINVVASFQLQKIIHVSDDLAKTTVQQSSASSPFEAEKK